MPEVRLDFNLDISDKSTWLTVMVAPPVRSRFVYVQELGDFFCGPGYYTRRENLASYLIKYTVSGEGSLTYNGATHALQPGTLFWLDCQRPHYYCTAPETGHWHVLWVHLYGATAQTYYETFLEQNQGSPVVSPGLEDSFSTLFGSLTYNGATHALQPGTLFWLDCQRPHYYCTAPETGHWHVLWVHLYGATAQTYYETFLEQNQGSPVVSPGLEDSFSTLFGSLFELYRSGGRTPRDDIQASGYLTQLMASCIRCAGKTVSVQQIPHYISGIREYIDAHYRDDITLDHLAQFFSINKYHLQKLFKRYTGFSPNEYLARTRLARAKHLLRTTGIPMIQVAEEVGYTATYFDSIFRKYEGITPRTYRKQWYKPESPAEGAPTQ